MFAPRLSSASTILACAVERWRGVSPWMLGMETSAPADRRRFTVLRLPLLQASCSGVRSRWPAWRFTSVPFSRRSLTRGSWPFAAAQRSTVLSWRACLCRRGVKRAARLLLVSRKRFRSLGLRSSATSKRSSFGKLRRDIWCRAGEDGVE